MKVNLKALDFSKKLQIEDLTVIDNLNRNQRNHIDIYNLK